MSKRHGFFACKLLILLIESIYWREASSGHSRSAYFVGKNLSSLFRLSLSALHFTAFYTILAAPIMSFNALYATNLLYFYCISLPSSSFLEADNEVRYLWSGMLCINGDQSRKWSPPCPDCMPNYRGIWRIRPNPLFDQAMAS